MLEAYKRLSVKKSCSTDLFSCRAAFLSLLWVINIRIIPLVSWCYMEMEITNISSSGSNHLFHLWRALLKACWWLLFALKNYSPDAFTTRMLWPWPVSLASSCVSSLCQGLWLSQAHQHFPIVGPLLLASALPGPRLLLPLPSAVSVDDLSREASFSTFLLPDAPGFFFLLSDLSLPFHENRDCVSTFRRLQRIALCCCN